MVMVRPHLLLVLRLLLLLRLLPVLVLEIPILMCCMQSGKALMQF